MSLTKSQITNQFIETRDIEGVMKANQYLESLKQPIENADDIESVNFKTMIQEVYEEFNYRCPSVQRHK